MDDPEEYIAYEKAKKRVEKERDFYIHLAVYIILNIVIFIFKQKILIFIDADISDKDFMHWWNLGNILTPILWFIGLFFHWLWAFGKIFMFSDQWEEKKIRKIMEEEEDQYAK